MNEKEREPQLPASILAAWGIQDRPRRGPRPGLTLDGIVEAAIEVARSGGLEAVSMGRVAEQIGVSTMSLYRYVAAKDELLALMADAIFDPELAGPAVPDDWRAGLTNWAASSLGIFRRHPWVLRVPLSGPPITPNRITWLELGLRSLEEAELSETEKLSTLLLVTSFTWNYALIESDLLEAAMGSSELALASTFSYGGALASLTDSQNFPALTRLIEAGAFEGDETISDEFTFGLERILDGIEVLIERRLS